MPDDDVLEVDGAGEEEDLDDDEVEDDLADFEDPEEETF